MRSTTFTARGDQIRWSDLAGAPATRGGTLPATVFLHGLGGTGASVFGHVAGDPLLGGRRSLVIDLPGHGHSDRPTDFGYSLDEHASAVAAVLDGEGLRAIDLVGHSMGGSIGIVLAHRRPDLVGRLVVAEAVLDRLPHSTTGLGSQWMASMSEAAFVEHGVAELSASDPGWGLTLRICAAFAVHRSAVALIAGTDPSLRSLLSALPIPRTFIAGADGEGVERADGLGASGVQAVVVPDAGHSMMNDQPEIFIRELAAALAVGA